MSVQQHLLDLGDLFNFSDLSTFTQNIPVEWVALDLSSQATIRRRRLPADVQPAGDGVLASDEAARRNHGLEQLGDQLVKNEWL